MTFKPADLAQHRQSGWDEVRKVLDRPIDPASAKRAVAELKDAPSVPKDVFDRFTTRAEGVSSAGGKGAAVVEAASNPEAHKALLAAVAETQERIAGPIAELQKELGKLVKEETSLRIRHGWKSYLTGQPAPPEALKPEAKAKYEEVKSKQAEVQAQLDQLSAAGRVLTALRGDKSRDGLSVLLMTGATWAPVPGAISTDYWLGTSVGGRDRATGKRAVKLTNQFSVDTPWASVKKFAEETGTGYSVNPVPFVYTVRDPFFGTNVGIRVPGLFFAGVSRRPDGESAVEVGGNPVVLAAAAMGLMGLGVPALLTAAAGFFIGPYGGVLVGHEKLDPVVDLVQKHWTPIIKGAEDNVCELFTNPRQWSEKVMKGIKGVGGRVRDALGPKEDDQPAEGAQRGGA